MTQAEYERNFFHIGEFASLTTRSWLTTNKLKDHCQEHFREVFMYRGEIALTTFFYRQGGQVTAKLLAEHECVNWNRLESWTATRRINLEETVLVPPEIE